MVTGAAGNLGRATATAFAACGAHCVLVDVSHDGVQALAQECGSAIALQADLTDASSVARTVDLALEKWGRIDVLCNVAGGFRMGPAVHETGPAFWRLMMQLNTETLMNAVAAVVPAMLKSGHGKIINVAAIAGTVGRARMGAYSASKSAVIRLTETMASELREQNINVNCVVPSILDTPQNRADMPEADPHRWVPLDALADVIVFLASDQARALHGAALPVVALS